MRWKCSSGGNLDKGVTLEKGLPCAVKKRTPVLLELENGGSIDLTNVIEARLNASWDAQLNAYKNNGPLGTTWDWIKDITDLGDSFGKISQMHDNEWDLFRQFHAGNPNKEEVFKKLTGIEYTPDNLEKFINGEILLPSEEAVKNYLDGQEVAVDIMADVCAGGAAFVVAAVSVGGTVFTGGTSLAGIALAAGTGSCIKVLIKGCDAKSAGREYTLQDIAYDSVTGAFSGALAPVTAGIGNAANNFVLKGGRIVLAKAMGKEAIKEGTKLTTKQAVAQAAITTTAKTVEFVVDGSLGGGIDNAFRTGINGGNAEEILDAGITGAKYSAVLGPVMGHAGHAVGKGFCLLKGAVKHADDIAPTSTPKSTRTELREKIASGQKVFQNSDITILKGRLKAPSSKFAETDEAYKALIQKNEAALLAIHLKHAGNSSRTEFIKDVYNIFIKDMDLEGIAPRLEIDPNFPAYGAFDALNRKITINSNYIDKEIIDTIAHELNHFIQFKEMVLTGSDGLERYAHNSVVAYFNRLNKEGKLKEFSQTEFNEMFADQVRNDIATLKRQYSDLMIDPRYPKNTDPNNYYYQKANQYSVGEATYTPERDNILEIESWRRGNLVGDLYNSLTDGSPRDRQIVSGIHNWLMEVNPNISHQDLCDLVADALVISRQPECRLYSVDGFVKYYKQIILNSN